MRRLALGCTSESHPLYGTFMSRLTCCIFEWDPVDYNHLLSAKRDEFVRQGVVHPSDSAVRKAVTKDELARHCHRTTRGADVTSQMIENLLQSLAASTDAIGVPLL